MRARARVVHCVSDAVGAGANGLTVRRGVRRLSDVCAVTHALWRRPPTAAQRARKQRRAPSRRLVGAPAATVRGGRTAPPSRRRRAGRAEARVRNRRRRLRPIALGLPPASRSGRRPPPQNGVQKHGSSRSSKTSDGGPPQRVPVGRRGRAAERVMSDARPTVSAALSGALVVERRALLDGAGRLAGRCTDARHSRRRGPALRGGAAEGPKSASGSNHGSRPPGALQRARRNGLVGRRIGGSDCAESKRFFDSQPMSLWTVRTCARGYGGFWARPTIRCLRHRSWRTRVRQTKLAEIESTTAGGSSGSFSLQPKAMLNEYGPPFKKAEADAAHDPPASPPNRKSPTRTAARKTGPIAGRVRSARRKWQTAGKQMELERGVFGLVGRQVRVFSVVVGVTDLEGDRGAALGEGPSRRVEVRRGRRER